MYSNHVTAFDTAGHPEDPAWFVDLVAREREAYQKLWMRNFPKAASAYGAIADDAEKHDPRLAAWYLHWQACAADWNGDEIQATRAFLAAANERVELGRPQTKAGAIVSAELVIPSAQAKAISKLFAKNRGNPPDDLLIVPLEQFVELVKRVEEMFGYGARATYSRVDFIDWTEAGTRLLCRYDCWGTGAQSLR